MLFFLLNIKFLCLLLTNVISIIFFSLCRPRRRSGSSIVVIDGDDLKPCLPDDYISSQHYRQHSGESKEIDQEMLTMLSVNQDNGELWCKQAAKRTLINTHEFSP